MSSKTFLRIVGIIFAVGATVQLFRFVFGWNVVLGTWNVPVWLSLIIFAVLTYLSYTAFKLGGVFK